MASRGHAQQPGQSSSPDSAIRESGRAKGDQRRVYATLRGLQASTAVSQPHTCAIARCIHSIHSPNPIEPSSRLCCSTYTRIYIGEPFLSLLLCTLCYYTKAQRGNVHCTACIALLSHSAKRLTVGNFARLRISNKCA